MNNKTLAEIFVDGARKGWNMAASNIAPNVVMAFTAIYILKTSGLLAIIGKLLGPVMVIFGVPGEAIMVLLASWMSIAGGVGVLAGLLTTGIINETQVTILLPCCFLMGAQLQYLGRVLGTAGVNPKFYPAMMTICVINALCAMLVSRLLLTVVHF